MQQAIAAMQSKPKASVPMPSKRSSVMEPQRGRRRTRRVSDSSSDDDDDSTTNNESFSDHNRSSHNHHHHHHNHNHRDNHHRSSHHQPRSRHSRFEDDLSPPPLPVSSRPYNYVSHGVGGAGENKTSSTDTSNTSSPAHEQPPALPPPRGHSSRDAVVTRESRDRERERERDRLEHPRVLGVQKSHQHTHHSSSSRHHDYFYHIQERSDNHRVMDRERELLRQQHNLQQRHQKHQQQQKAKQERKHQKVPPQLEAHPHPHRSRRDHSVDDNLHGDDEDEDVDNEEVLQHSRRSAREVEEDRPPPLPQRDHIVKHQNNMNNNRQQHVSSSHNNNLHLSNISNSRHGSNVTSSGGGGGSAGSNNNSGSSSTSSTNEKPPEKPPERISSKSSHSESITLNQLADVMQSLSPPSRSQPQQPKHPSNISRAHPDVSHHPPSVKVSGRSQPASGNAELSSSPPPLPPRVNPLLSQTTSPPSAGNNATTQMLQQNHLVSPPSVLSISGQQKQTNTNTSTSNNSNHSGITSGSSNAGIPAPDYDAVYESQQNNRHAIDEERDTSLDSSRNNDSTQSLDGYSMTGTARYKVSAKIQQLLHTLSRPKKRPLPDFYVDDETDLEIAANQLDPSAPKPEGVTMTPPLGEALEVPAGLPKSLEEALSRYGSATFKAPAVTVLDMTAKVHPPLTYGKLYSRSRKIAYNLLNKVGHTRQTTVSTLSNSSHSSNVNVPADVTIKQGDRVALVFPNSDPFGFMCAFYGCLTAGVVPVPIEVPMTRRDTGSTQIGFLLGSCSVRYAITSEACLKGLPKTPTGELAEFKGWPRLTWLVPDNWSKAPKDWKPPPRISEDAPAYIEYTIDKDGSMKGVSISRSAMMAHSKALTAACSYTEGDIMVSVLDFKRDVGLWHSVLTSILNGMHIVFIPYSLMKVNPSSWMMMITKFKATVAVCKSRDLHWGLLATRDHKDVNLSSLRMLLVADGSNPWSLSSCDQFISVFNSRGLKPEAVCPCASSPEALTVAVRR